MALAVVLGLAAPIAAAAPVEATDTLPEVGSGATVGGQEIHVEDVDIPVPLAAAAAAGHRSSMALGRDGSVYTWGRNLGGQLGDGTDGPPGLRPVAVDTSGVLDGRRVTQMSSGNHNVALTEDGLLVAWGLGSDGRLGNGQTANSAVPVEVDMSGVLAGKTVVQVSAGIAHTAVLTDDGQVYTWGNGFSGELGTGHNVMSAVPVAVDTSGALAGERVVQVAVGGQRTVVLTESGKLLQWGLGLGKAPEEVDMSGVLAGRTVVSLSLSTHASVVLDSEGLVYTWGGSPDTGVLGNGTLDSSDVPVAVDTNGPLWSDRVVEVSAGDFFVLARTATGTIVAWGSGGSGVLGVGEWQKKASSPVRVNMNGALGRHPVVGLAAGMGHSLAVLADGSVVAWGGGGTGALGTGGTDDAWQPVETAPLPVPTPTIFLGSREHQATSVVHDAGARRVSGVTPAHPAGTVDVYVARAHAPDLGPAVGRFTFGVPPEVVTSPVGIRAVPGTEVTLSVSASGDEPPGAVWESSTDGTVWVPVDGEVVTTSDPTTVVEGQTSVGQTTSTVTFVVAEGAVQVRAVLDNTLGRATSEVAVVHGAQPPGAHLVVMPGAAHVHRL